MSLRKKDSIILLCGHGSRAAAHSENLETLRNKINKDFEVPSMENFGINQKNFEAELENMASDAEISGAPSLNPRVPSVNEMIDLYGKAWRAF